MRWHARALVILIPLVSLLPLGRVVVDWVQVAQITGESPRAAAPRGFDWVQWEDVEGRIVAAYVYPGGTAHEAGMRRGIELFQLNGQQFFSAEDVKSVVEGLRPGSVITYDLIDANGGEERADRRVEVLITRYPTFLYPLSGTLWQVSLWGFGLAAFLHIVGLVIVAPLARRTRRALRTTVLFGAASLWVVGNFGRLLAVTLFGASTVGWYASAFQSLTLVALAGWVLFPALLLHAVASDVRTFRLRAGPWYALLFVPPLVLGLTTLVLTLGGSIGPLTLDLLIGPILFYVCCNVAAATGLTLAAGFIAGNGRRRSPVDDVPAATAWSRAGSALVLVVAVSAALSVIGVAPSPDTMADSTVGWLTLVVQLLSVAPVGLVSVATLRHGRAESVFSGALAYLLLLGTAFFVVLAGLLLIERNISEAAGWTHALAGSLYVVLVLIAAERVVSLLRRRAARWLMTQRQRAREKLRAFGERVRTITDPQELAEATVTAVGEAMRPRSAVVFMRDPASPDDAFPSWLRGSFQPEPPYFTEAELMRVWQYLQAEGVVWSRNAELNESSLPAEDHRYLVRRGVALAVPIAGDEARPAGLIVLAGKERGRAVYNLEDVAQLRTLAGQLTLALERLALIEREKALVRETAQAQLAALRAQINPHFLFNTLNTIAALIDERPTEAEHVVERLARIFRHILQTGGQTFVALRDEVRLVQNYLAIEQARFGRNLKLRENWDPELMEIPIPAFTLQTLVENAVKHGIQQKRGGGTLVLASYRTDEGIVVSVRDDGPGIAALDEASIGGSGFFGIGLQNVSDRLDRLYGNRDLLRFESGPGSGTLAEIVIPQPA